MTSRIVVGLGRLLDIAPGISSNADGSKPVHRPWQSSAFDEILKRP